MSISIFPIHVPRRGLTGAIPAVALALGLIAAAPAEAAEQTRSMNGREGAIHALHRLALGPRPGGVERVMRTGRRDGRIGWKTWVRKQLDPQSVDDGALQQRLEDYPALKMSLTETQKRYRDPDDRQRDRELRRKLKRELIESTLIRAVYSKRQLQEVIVNFWRNHLYVRRREARRLTMSYEQDVIRAHAFGKFEDLLMASAKHPAMLKYLDNESSRAGGINENYARELMELHTLGADNYYTQEDVIQLARILTGWTHGWKEQENGERRYGFRFRANRHDSGPFKLLGLELEGGRGVRDGEAAISYLAHHPGTARFVSYKLCEYLVSDDPPKGLVEKAARTFRETDGDLKAVYEAILFSDAFASVRHYKSKFKTPFEYVISALRATDARISDPAEVLEALRVMGQGVYECPDPTGYEDRARAWLDPGVMVYRWDFAIRLVSGEIKGVSVPKKLYRPWAAARSRAIQARKVLTNLLPPRAAGRLDRDLYKKVRRLKDVRGMIGLTLGSPAFQQQ